ncbi:MAG: 3-hydroxyacyl-CoA dehydrogenase NAD-binding domain-containing protein [Gemmataceae bacterium]|nr:3-hydroxyacyl-CoA dehydrogenase NAD-binding domain-containing protein [Gemmataceae bacterium]
MAAFTAFRLEFSDNFASLTFDLAGSKANTLGQAVLAELEATLAQIEGRAGLQGLILQSGKPGMFIAGADLKELGSSSGDQAETRRLVERGLKLIARLEKLPFPTVALIDGACMGGGLELALGFDYRLAGAHPKVDIGLPEVKVGLIPGWGGTQRLPRVIGPALACELICAGDSVNAKRARDIGLVFDVVPSEKLQEEALRLLAWSRQSKDFESQRQRKRQPVGLTEEQLSYTFTVAKGMVLLKTKGQLPAPLAAVEAIAKGCNLPLEDGLRAETDCFVPLVGSTISRNFIAVFFLNQRLQKDPGVTDAAVQPKPVNRIGVVGAGIMGSGIAGAHVRRGIPALMFDVAPQALEKGVAAVAKVMQSRIEIGRMTPQEMMKAMALLATGQNLALLSDREVVIEAIVENEEAKKTLFQELQKHLPENAILASNTSTISITRMAQVLERPERFAGMHFFNPVDRMQLVEVIRGAKTNDETVVTLVALAKRIGKSPIVVRDCPGFLVNRILFPYINESLVLLEEGAGPRDIDKAAVAFGMPMGPITLNDLVGLDTSLYAGRVVNAAFADRAKNTRILDELVKAGRLGQKSGAGFFSYAKGSRGVDDPAFDALLAKCRTEKRTISQEEITDRLFLPMLVEASYILMEGIVRDPADVDMGLILGIGFPAYRGGLLRWADTIGLDKIAQNLSKYERLGKRFAPPELLRRLAAEKKRFFA